ncbi:MAG: DNA polymerase III subunit beta [Marinilabiliaceae bacterium]|nr:DNA polymerase III subunit beta [Marinilabiliaceae bacterium]
MKFKVSSGDLERRLSVLSRVIESKPSTPIWSHFLFETIGDSLRITAGSQDIIMQTELSILDSEQDAKSVLPGEKLIAYLKTLPEQPVTMSIDENNSMVIYTSAGKSSQMGESADQWPQNSELKEDSISTFTISSQSLLTGISRTAFAISSDELRPVLNGIFFEIEPTTLTMVATDSQKLVRYTRTDVQAGINASFVLNRRPANILKSALDKEDSMIRIEFDSKIVRFHLPLYTISCTQPEGNYPPYRTAIPTNNPYTLVINRQNLLNAVQRVSLYSNTTKLIRLDVGSDSVNISAQDIDFACQAKEMISGEFDGDSLSIGFKATNLTEVLSNLESEDISIRLLDSVRATLVSPSTKHEGEDELMLIMPMKV